MRATEYIGNKSFSVFEKKIVNPEEGEVRIKVAYVGYVFRCPHLCGMMDKRVNIPELLVMRCLV